MAEISVPAWPMPIHQTKFVMSNAQPTGMLLPQIPMPFMNRCPTDTSRRPASVADTPRPAIQPAETFRVRTMELILSVIVANECPGAMYAPCCSPPPAGPVTFVSAMRYFSPCASPAASPVARAGCTFFNAARYVVRGRVFSSPRSE